MAAVPGTYAERRESSREMKHLFDLKIDDEIQIGDDIRIGIENIRLGIDAPRNVPVHREEIADLIRQTGRDWKAVV